MCGIVGQIEFNQKIDLINFNEMRDSMFHRGPDGKGTWINSKNNIALGHRRLSFLDVSENGAQPMMDSNGNYYITFNGEIYNYLELKNELEGKGYSFTTQTDTEVILNGFIEWNVGILNKLKGMFAFAIWNEKEEKLFLARDRFGIKPLYYLFDENRFVFASEIKGIKKCNKIKTNVNFTSVAQYLTYRFVPSPNTIWKEIHKIPPAHYLQLNFKSKKKILINYWELKSGNKIVKPREAIEKVNGILQSSVKNHLRSDVPIGAFLSGGYDSSALVSMMVQQNYQPQTFSIGFNHWEQSEDQYAKIVAKHLNVENETIRLDSGQLNLLPKLMYHYDEPLADISIIPTYCVSELAAKKVKAVFSGEGADEIFVGYDWQKELANQNDISDKVLIEKYGQAMSMGQFLSQDIIKLLHPDLQKEVPKKYFSFYESHVINNSSPLKKFQYLDVKSFMGELVLTKIDRASMAHSLEVRVPFLDHELVEYLFLLDTSVYFKKNITKYLLFENIKKQLPQEILQRKKQGFVGPDQYYMNYNWYVEQLVNGELIKEGILQENALTRMIARNEHWKLWKIIVLEFWWREWV